MRRLAPAGLVLALMTALLFAVGASSEPVDGVRVPTVEQLNDLDARVTELENRPTPTVTATATVTVTETVTAEPTPTETTPPPPPEPAKKIVGMSAGASVWSQRLAEVGPNGITARRIFADLTSSGQDQSDLIEQAIAAGMMPVVSYKLPTPYNHSAVTAGTYDASAVAAGNYLASLGVPVAFTIWHEPRGDIPGPQYLVMHKRLMPLIKDGRSALLGGPILNGWMLTGSSTVQTEFRTFVDPAALAMWDWFGIDTYQSGTPSNPGSIYPGHRVAPMVSLLNSFSEGSKPLLIGEYNGFSGESLAESGEIFLSTPTLWVVCFWNSQAEGDKGTPLVPGTERMEAFQATKADARVLQ